MEATGLKKISTSALAKSLSLTSKELFGRLEAAGWIIRNSDSWELTEKGKSKGGEYTSHSKYGTYICWPKLTHIDPEKLIIPKNISTPSPLLTATALADETHLPARQVNNLLAELGWIRKGLRGWQLTASGQAIGGAQKEDRRTGYPYVCWPAEVLEHSAFQHALKEIQGDLTLAIGLDDSTSDIDDYLTRFPATLRTADGHMVRSRGDMLIDNWLYMAGITHACGRRLPIEENAWGDFYLPEGSVYIEYLGAGSDSAYKALREKRVSLYQSHNLNVITLSDDDLSHLDEILPRQLLKYGIAVY
ncbi:hypothetical protein [Parendozoicomonas sp. Alg238-R29]|uniref:hypothetical protein n=1 Tax=Parendozoicomonas sp. Alg238-R29 TaxID=2993446 RepID=UPI00248DD591|nr:hypothetical protein [Parendozoicomonas sp. Alg238-R29]